VITLGEGNSGVTWIGTERGLYRLINGTLVPPDFKHDPLPIHDIIKDKYGNVWYTNQRTGVYKIAADGTEVLNYSSRDGLVNDAVNGLFEDSQGRIWMATNHGLSCFYNGKFTNYSRTDGLSEDTCVFVQEDDNHYIWIGTSNGIYRFDGNSFRNYTSRDGLASVDLVQGSCFKDSFLFILPGARLSKIISKMTAFLKNT
jgi:ligand-binding sensor domain-containing protein